MTSPNCTLARTFAHTLGCTLALALPLLATQAQASTQTLGPIGAPIESAVFGNPTGTFFDTLNFSVLAPGQLHVTLSDLELTQVIGSTSTVVFDNVALSGNLYNNFHPNGTEQLGSLGSFDHTFAFFLPSAGNYHLDFGGDAVGVKGGYYGVALSVSAVPEPNTYALMLAGIAALGFCARRRRGS